MLEETQDTEELIERVAALDIGKAELVCCVRVPGEGKGGRRLQEVRTYTTMTRSQSPSSSLASDELTMTGNPLAETSRRMR